MKLKRRNLSIRMKGEDVTILQNELKKLGFTLPANETNKGYFGKETRQAVMKFQKQRGLQTTGIVDERTAAQINAAVEANQAKKFIVQGLVFQHDGQTPAINVVVRAYDKDLRIEELLGETFIDNKKGYYLIEYKDDHFTRDEKHSADLIVRVYSTENVELAASDILFNAPVKAKIDLVLTKPEQPPKLSEYEKLLADLAPVLQDVQLYDLTEQYITFLYKETGITKKRIEFLVQSAQLSRETELPTAVIYGLARQGLPLDLESLLNQALKVLRNALETAIKKNIIPSSLLDSLDKIMARLEQLRFERGVLVRLDFFGQLLNLETETPLDGFTVRAFDLDAGETPKELGTDISNNRGSFVLSYPVLKSEIPGEDPDNGPGRRLRLQIIDPQGEEIFQTEIQFKVGSKQMVEIKVPVPIPEEPPAPTLKELDTTLQLQLPRELLSYLDDQGIGTLADIRKKGGLRNIEGLPVDPDHPAVQTLEAHANLYTTTSSIQANAKLIQKGYTSAVSIAGAPRTDIVGLTHKVVGDLPAARRQVEALAGTQFLNNLVTSLRTEKANGRPIPVKLEKALEGTPPSPCHCKNCEAAMSPMAYLADILDYAVTHFKLYEDEDDNTGTAISLDYLKENFHQPFGNLPSSCEEMEKQVRQVRICIEVLRSYLGERPLPDVDKENALSDEEVKYRTAVYTTLLNKLGTSYEEIRLARTAEEETRTALAGRLGIGVEHLDHLFITPEAITEETLEQLFGLVDTTRDPLSDPGSVTPDFPGWRLQHLRSLWWQQDWPEEESSHDYPLIYPDLIGPGDFKNLVGGDPAYELWQARSDFAAGLVDALKTEREAGATDLAGLDAILEHTRVGLAADLAALVELRGQGENIDEQLQALNLTNEAFNYLLRIREIAEEESPILDDEWQDVYSILVQIQKKDSFTTWRQEEKDNGITLSPDYFKLPEPPPLEFPPKEPEPLPAWRAAGQARRDWQNSLRSRIE